MRTNDQFDMYNGAHRPLRLEARRQEGNVCALQLLQAAQRSEAQILATSSSRGHINQDLARYELHRVWVVDATLKPGTSHIYSRRTFYIDEDSWQILAIDQYDGRGQLWRYSEQHNDQLLRRAHVLRSTVEVHNDLQSRRYIAMGLRNEEKVSTSPQAHGAATTRRPPCARWARANSQRPIAGRDEEGPRCRSPRLRHRLWRLGRGGGRAGAARPGPAARLDHAPAAAPGRGAGGRSHRRGGRARLHRGERRPGRGVVARACARRAAAHRGRLHRRPARLGRGPRFGHPRHRRRRRDLDEAVLGALRAAPAHGRAVRLARGPGSRWAPTGPTYETSDGGKSWNRAQDHPGRQAPERDRAGRAGQAADRGRGGNRARLRRRGPQVERGRLAVQGLALRRGGGGRRRGRRVRPARPHLPLHRRGRHAGARSTTPRTPRSWAARSCPTARSCSAGAAGTGPREPRQRPLLRGAAHGDHAHARQGDARCPEQGAAAGGGGAA